MSSKTKIPRRRKVIHWSGPWKTFLDDPRFFSGTEEVVGHVKAGSFMI